MQNVLELEVEMEPAGQGRQLLWPVEFWKVPGRQADVRWWGKKGGGGLLGKCGNAKGRENKELAGNGFKGKCRVSIVCPQK